jgi:AhpD family alkylhydroperoxidase
VATRHLCPRTREADQAVARRTGNQLGRSPGYKGGLDTLCGMSDEPKAKFRFWTDGYHALEQLGQAVKDSGLEPGLLELVKMRASQVNGCAYCIDMHSRDARAQGETEQRLYALSAWRETPFFSERERGALALTEAVTLVAETHIPEAVVDDAASVFEPEELTKLLYLIIEINAWNRLAITTGAPEPGTYRPGQS